MQSSRNLPDHEKVRGWILDVYPSGLGEFAVWVIAENGQRLRLTDSFKPRIYVSGKEESLVKLARQFLSDARVVSWDFAPRYAKVTDVEPSRLLEIVLQDCRQLRSFAQKILKSGRFLHYTVFNCDLKHEQLYFYEHDVFPLAFVEVKSNNARLEFNLLDSADTVDYVVPSLKILKMDVEAAKQGKFSKLTDPIGKIKLRQGGQTETIDSGSERDKLLQLVHAIKDFDSARRRLKWTRDNSTNYPVRCPCCGQKLPSA